MNRQIRMSRALATTLRAVVLSAALAGAAHAAPITLTFSSTDAVGFGGVGIDITVVFHADTANYAGRYNGLTATVSSTALGLTDAVTTNTLDIINDVINGGVLLASGPINLSVFNPIAWDGVSDFTASQLGTNSVSGGPRLTINGQESTVTFNSFTNVKGATAAFSAKLDAPATVPEPAPLALVGLALAGLALQRSRKA